MVLYWQQFVYGSVRMRRIDMPHSMFSQLKNHSLGESCKRYHMSEPLADPKVSHWPRQSAILERQFERAEGKKGVSRGTSRRNSYLGLDPGRKPSKSAYIPLDFVPGERAEFDFGEATVKIKGQLVKVPFLAGRLRFSGAMFVECFPTLRQEAFLLGQRHAFEFWGGVPRMAVYDNLKPAVLQVLDGHHRREHEVFLHFQSVYRFEALFANVHAGWEKGSVENLVGYARRNYLVPLS